MVPVISDFNPHTREGCDLMLVSWIHDVPISIHTPARGVTDGISIRLDLDIDFNPHTREGCDQLVGIFHLPAIDFNPHTREGCDRAGSPACEPG